MIRLPSHIRLSLARRFTPPRIFLLSFASVILMGTFLVWAPFSHTRPISFIDALFTATSAVCVTGLAVLDIGKDLSLPGQLITLFLFQIGGLGIITFSVFFFALMGRSVSFKGRDILQSTFLHTPRRNFGLIAKWVVLFTLSIEILGAVILYIRFIHDFSAGRALYLAIYHAVSAFNNCGYSLFADSLIRYQGDLIINLTIMALIILGGIGFIVQYEVYARWKGYQRTLSIHSKIVLITTTILIFGGAGLFCLFEAENILKDVGPMTGILASFFQSVTARTCGFNTVDIGQLTNATILVIIILMFVGASPGSTGGGIKTTSFALLMMMIWNRFRGHDEMNVFKRTIPRDILTRTISIIIASAFSVCLVATILLFLSPNTGQTPLESRHWLVEYLFETVSAFGTVGLSMGITAKLSAIQKIAITLMMFAGRVGPLTLAFSWSVKKKRITYAEESVMVG